MRSANANSMQCPSQEKKLNANMTEDFQKQMRSNGRSSSQFRRPLVHPNIFTFLNMCMFLRQSPPPLNPKPKKIDGEKSCYFCVGGCLRLAEKNLFSLYFCKMCEKISKKLKDVFFDPKRGAIVIWCRLNFFSHESRNFFWVKDSLRKSCWTEIPALG